MILLILVSIKLISCWYEIYFIISEIFLLKFLRDPSRWLIIVMNINAEYLESIQIHGEKLVAVAKKSKLHRLTHHF